MINETEIILAVIGLAGTGITLLRYMFTQMRKMQQEFLDSQQEQQNQLFKYVETKNGHMERISERFAQSSDKMSDKIGELVRAIDKIS